MLAIMAVSIVAHLCHGRVRHGRRLVVQRPPGDAVGRRRRCARRRAEASGRPRHRARRSRRSTATRTAAGSRADPVQLEHVRERHDLDEGRARRPGFLARVLGITSVNVRDDATARAWNLGSAKYAAPFAVDKAHPMLRARGCPCFRPDYDDARSREGRPRRVQDPEHRRLARRYRPADRSATGS